MEKRLNRLAFDMLRKADNSQETLNQIIMETLLNENDGNMTKALDFTTGTTVTQSLLNPLTTTDVDATIRELNVNGFLSRTNAQMMYSTIRELGSAVDKMFTYVDSKEILYHVEVAAASRRRLISRERVSSTGGTVDTSRRDELISILGFDIKTEQVGVESDIKLEVIANNLWNPNFLSTLDTEMAKLKADDISELLTLGRGTAGTSFYQLFRGYEHILKHMSNNVTFSNESKVVWGEYAYLLTPHKMNVKNVHDDLTTWSGKDTFNLFDAMKKILPSEYRNDPKNAFIVSQEDYDAYEEYRTLIGMPMTTNAVGVNTETRESGIQNGFMPRHRGYKLVVNRWASSIAEGGIVVFGDISQFMVVQQSGVVKRYMEFNPRNGGGAWERTDSFRYGTGIRDKEKLVVAGSVLGWDLAGTTAKTSQLTDLIKADAPHIVDARYSHLAGLVDLTTGYTYGDDAYIFGNLNPNRYKVLIGVAGGSETFDELVTVDNKLDPGTNLADVAVITDDTTTYKIAVWDKYGMIDGTVATLTVTAAS